MSIKLVLSGGFGNQLFQYASARALSLHLGVDLKVDLRYYVGLEPNHSRRPWILDFPICCSQAKYKSRQSAHGLLARATRFIPERLRRFDCGLGFDPKFWDIKDKTSLFGLYQSHKFFESRFSEFSDEINIEKLVESKKLNYSKNYNLSEFAGVHVRRGDYLHNAGFEMRDWKNYYSKSMDIIKRSGCRALIFSDDIPWCREQELFLGAEFYEPADADPPYVDMCAMMNCSRLVIANSSFSWWAGWFASQKGAIVTAPSNWILGYKSQEISIVPDGWKILD